MNQEELSADRTIDPEQLDIEAIQQADLYGKWAVRSAKAKAEADRLEWAAELLEAKTQMDVRNHPGKYDIDNLTEGAVKAAVKLDKGYIKAVEAWHAARLEAAMADRAEKAMAQKKGMIEELVKLHGQQYFAGPGVPRDIISAWQAHKSHNEEAVGDRLRSTVRRRNKADPAEARP